MKKKDFNEEPREEKLDRFLGRIGQRDLVRTMWSINFSDNDVERNLSTDLAINSFVDFSDGRFTSNIYRDLQYSNMTGKKDSNDAMEDLGKFSERFSITENENKAIERIVKKVENKEEVKIGDFYNLGKSLSTARDLCSDHFKRWISYNKLWGEKNNP
ncbi:MAG: hypothetical protein NUV46_04260 [Nanoarchaeota archaeon]|nr:hypothetical protein [Nanoarchaeota archaeon]